MEGVEGLVCQIPEVMAHEDGVTAPRTRLQDQGYYPSEPEGDRVLSTTGRNEQSAAVRPVLGGAGQVAFDGSYRT